MRAVLISEGPRPEQDSAFTVSGDSAHHLIKVVRVRAGEEIVLLDGKGLRAKCKISTVTKHEVIAEVQTVEQVLMTDRLHLALALPKKEAFEEAIRAAVECGVTRIIPIISDYSQRETRFSDRLERVLESALIQSNNLYMPKISAETEIENLPSHMGPCRMLYFFDSQGEGQKLNSVQEGPVMMLIGPEGGFSPAERHLIRNFDRAQPLKLETPIMRTPTAVAAAAGHLLAFLK